MRKEKLRNLEKQAEVLLNPPLFPLVYRSPAFPIDFFDKVLENGVKDINYERCYSYWDHRLEWEHRQFDKWCVENAEAIRKREEQGTEPVIQAQLSTSEMKERHVSQLKYYGKWDEAKYQKYCEEAEEYTLPGIGT